MTTANTHAATPPTWFRTVSWVALVWNAVGLLSFVGRMTLEPGSVSEAEWTYYETTPLWAHAAFGVAVVAGVLGCVGLVLRRIWSTPVFIASFVGIVVQVFHGLVLADGLGVFGAQAVVLPVLTLAIAAALIWLARAATRHGWLR